MKRDPIERQRARCDELHERIKALRAERKGPGDLPEVLKRENTKLIAMQNRAERRSKRAA